MPDAAYNSIMTEAVAVFHDVESFEAAIDNLLAVGFDHANINVLAHEDTIASKLGPTHKSTAEFEDDPEVPRIGYIPNETIGNAEGAVIGAGVYVPAMFGGLAWRPPVARCSVYLLQRRCRRSRRSDRGSSGALHRSRARQASRSASAPRRTPAVGQNARRRVRRASPRDFAPPLGP
jgi:hypothetical protein